jgi:hypothetical protein
VFLDANEEGEKEISPERKLREVLLRFCAATQPIAGIFTIASMSIVFIGGNGESFFVFDSVSSSSSDSSTPSCYLHTLTLCTSMCHCVAVSCCHAAFSYVTRSRCSRALWL